MDGGKEDEHRYKILVMLNSGFTWFSRYIIPKVQKVLTGEYTVKGAAL